MAGFKVQKQNASALAVDDLGLTIAGAALSIYDLTHVSPENLARSTDLSGFVSGGDILVVDTRDDSDATIMSLADSLQAIENHNDTHFGISGGRFGAVDDPTVTPTDDFILQYDSGSDVIEYIDPATLVTQTTVQEAIEDIVGGMGINGTDTTFTYLDGAGTIEWSVNDVFLRNTGDTLDSGTLSIASGATVDFPTGSNITIAGDVASATIETPAGGFVNDNDLINKFYVDQVASGLDWKESARASTTVADGDITGGSFGGTYAAGGGPEASGEFTGVDLSAGTGDTIDGINFTGTAATGYVIGDRILIKDQTDATQNGIYVITAAPTADDVTLTRATDQDGSPTSEVSGGNTVYIEDTTAINASSVNSNTVWSIIFDGEIDLNTDDIDWTQVAGPGSFIARDGLSRDGVIIDLDVDDLTTATVVATDTIAFHDVDGAANSSGSQTRKTTFASVFSELDVVNGITANGIIVRTADDTYASRTIEVEGAGDRDGLSITDGDGIAGNPTIGLDIEGLPVTAAVDSSDRVAVWDSSTDSNVYYTVGQIAGAVSASDSFVTWTGAGNTTGDASIVADNSADTATITGGIGINIDLTAVSDTITWSFTNDGMADTAVVGADTFPFFDASNADEPEFRSFTDLITDLGLLTSGNQVVFTSVTGDTGTATADDNADSVALIGATNGGITTVATDGPEQVTFAITGVDLTTGAATLALGDFIIVNDSADTATTVSLKYTFGDMITDLGIQTTANAVTWTTIDLSGGNNTGDASVAPATIADTLNLSAGVGLNFDGSDATDTIVATFSNDGMANTAVVGADTIPFFDASNADDPEFRSFTDIISDLGLLTSGNTVYWTTQALSGNTSGDATVDPATAADTLTWVGGDGINLTGSDAGDSITIAFTRAGLADTAVTTADTVPFFDASATNQPEYRAWSDIITDLGLNTTANTLFWGDINTTGNTAGDTTPAADPDVADDTLTFNGGIGITITGTAAADTLSWAFSRAGLADTAVVLADTVPFFDASNSNEPEFRSLSDIFADLDVPNGIAANGFVVRTAADTYASRTIDASVDEDELGIVITDGDGVAGDPQIGLDIVGLTDPDDDMAATDEFAVHDKSEGTAGANRKMTGQNIADGVEAILGITGLTISTINGQPIPTYTDSTRTKQLSTDTAQFQWADNKLDDNDWMRIGTADDADNGWVMPLDGTIVMATGFTEDGKSATMAIDVYIDGVDSGPVGTLTGAGNAQFVGTTLNLDVDQGERLSLRGDRTAGSGDIGDVNVVLFVRWRA